MILKIKITPNASKTEIIGTQEGMLKIKVAAPPDKNKANEKLIEFLSEHFNVPKSNIQILSGKTSRIKRIEIVMNP